MYLCEWFIHTLIGLSLQVIWAGVNILSALCRCFHLTLSYLCLESEARKMEKNAGDCAAVLKKVNCKELRVKRAHVKLKGLRVF